LSFASWHFAEVSLEKLPTGLKSHFDFFELQSKKPA